MEIIIKIGQLLLSLTLLVILHEMGHFLAARLFKARVEKFYLFFNPWFSLFKFKKGDTEYGIGWLPLGGYVKIAGMIDESMDTKQLKQPPKPDEFRSKTTWQRLIIMLAGVFVNFILAYFIYVGVSYQWGETYLPNDSLKYGVEVSEMGQKLGLQNGDKILKIDDKTPKKFSQLAHDIIITQPQTLTVLRGQDTLVLPIPEAFQKEVLTETSKSFNATPLLLPRKLFAPFYIYQVAKGSPAEKYGLQKEDRILKINGLQFKYYDKFQNYLKTQTDKTIALTILRNGQEKELNLTLGQDAKMGVYVDMSRQEQLQLQQENYGFVEAFGKGGQELTKALKSQMNSLKIMMSKEGVNSVGGLGSMYQIFPTYWSWESFWRITALLSIMFAFLNVLPIPGLDGGHAIFIIYEMITGRKPNQRFMEIVQTIGILFLFGLIIFVNLNDLFRFLN